MGDAAAQNSSGSAFDRHHPPSTDLISECVHCGFCLPSCPTYALWGREMDSPRGRIYLMKLGAEGEVSLDETFVGHMDNCLGCMACLSSCPSGVRYNQLIEATRSQIERNYSRSLPARLLRWLIFETFPRPDRLRWLLGLTAMYRRAGLQRLVRGSGILNLLPAGLRAMEALLPEVVPKSSPRELPAVVHAAGARRQRVALLLGCVQRVVFPGVNWATARVLAAEGCEVVIPPEQGCCGALMVHAGEEDKALDYARHTIDAFDGMQVDAIVSNAAGCGSSTKDYGYLLRDDPAYAARAQEFSSKCRDISEFLGELEPRSGRHPLPLKVVLHDPCHLQHAQRVRSQLRQVLGQIPDLQVVDPPEASLCCGSAGIYNLVKPEAAAELGQRKVQTLLATNPDVVATANPGCVLQLQAGLRATGNAIPVVHLVELLDASIRGVAAEEFQKQRGA